MRPVSRLGRLTTVLSVAIALTLGIASPARAAADDDDGPPTGDGYVVHPGLTPRVSRFIGLAELSLGEGYASQFYGGFQLGGATRAHEFRGLFQLGGTNAARDFVGLVQLGGWNRSGVKDGDADVRGRRFLGLAQLGGYNRAYWAFGGVAQAGVLNRAGEFAGALQVGLWNDTRRAFRGLAQIGLYNNAAYQFDGALQVSVINTAEDFAGGAQVGVVNYLGRGFDAGFNHGGRFRGLLQLGVANLVGGEATAFFQLAVLGNWTQGRTTALLQASHVNYVGSFRGLLQVGLGNITRAEHVGIQVGAVNVARRVRGVQIGVVNKTEDLAGLQIGLVNLAERGAIAPVLPLLNAGFGAPKTYEYGSR